MAVRAMAVSAGGYHRWVHRRARRCLRAWQRLDPHGLLAVLAGAGAHVGVLAVWG